MKEKLDKITAKEREKKDNILQIKFRILENIASANEDSEIYRRYRKKNEDSEIYRRYRKKMDLKGADLAKLRLQGLQLQEVDLRMVNFQLAALPNADLQAAGLQGEGPYLTNLNYVDLRMANLQGASLKYVSLERADLLGADLRKVIGFGSCCKTLAILNYALLCGDDVKDATNPTEIIGIYKQSGNYLFTFGRPKEGEKPFDKSELIGKLKEAQKEFTDDQPSLSLGGKTHQKIMIINDVIDYIEKAFPD